jgi:hypothetical protein
MKNTTADVNLLRAEIAQLHRVLDEARAEINTANKEPESETLNTEQPEQLPAPNRGSYYPHPPARSRVLSDLALALALASLLVVALLLMLAELADLPINAR